MAVPQCDHRKLSHVPQKAGHKRLIFVARDRNLFLELIDIVTVVRNNRFDKEGEDGHSVFSYSRCH